MTSSLMVVEEKLALALPLPRARHIMSDFTDVSRTVPAVLRPHSRQQVSEKDRARVAGDGAATSRSRDHPHSLTECTPARITNRDRNNVYPKHKFLIS